MISDNFFCGNDKIIAAFRRFSKEQHARTLVWNFEKEKVPSAFEASTRKVDSFWQKPALQTLIDVRKRRQPKCGTAGGQTHSVCWKVTVAFSCIDCAYSPPAPISVSRPHVPSRITHYVFMPCYPLLPYSFPFSTPWRSLPSPLIIVHLSQMYVYVYRYTDID